MWCSLPLRQTTWLNWKDTRSDEKSLLIKLPVPQSCRVWVCGSGFFRAAFFIWQPSGCLAQYLSCNIAPVYVKTNKQQERTQDERRWQERIPLTVNIGGCISGGSPRKLPSRTGWYFMQVWVASSFLFCPLLLLHTLYSQPCSLFTLLCFFSVKPISENYWVL